MKLEDHHLGKRALEFEGDEVLQIGQNNHVIAIFVGTLMKGHKEKQQYLSGAAACRWYINENDIPKIKSFQKKGTIYSPFLFMMIESIKPTT
jgi:hypothetical protein